MCASSIPFRYTATSRLACLAGQGRESTAVAGNPDALAITAYSEVTGTRAKGHPCQGGEETGIRVAGRRMYPGQAYDSDNYRSSRPRSGVSRKGDYISKFASL